MDLKDFLERFRLVDIKPDIKIEQGGVVNVKVEHHHYYLQLPDSEALKKFQEADITPELEEKIKNEVTKLLTPLAPALNALPETYMKEMVISTSIAKATEVVSVNEAVSVKIK